MAKKNLYAGTFLLAMTLLFAGCGAPPEEEKEILGDVESAEKVIPEKKIPTKDDLEKFPDEEDNRFDVSVKDKIADQIAIHKEEFDKSFISKEDIKREVRAKIAEFEKDNPDKVVVLDDTTKTPFVPKKAKSDPKIKKEIKPIKTLVLTALPGSGKSELRRYLTEVDAEKSRKEFGLNSVVELDDYPYVHMMRRISDECISRNIEGTFFRSTMLPFKDAREWGTLIELLNEDYDDMVNNRTVTAQNAAEWLFARIDAAREKLNAPSAFAYLTGEQRKQVAQAVETDARKLLDDKVAEISKAAKLKEKTIVLEFARGGATGSEMPLPAPYGYKYALATLSPQILADASVLYIKVTPSISRQKNIKRAKPGEEGSILNHSVPLAVMYGDYGLDDIAYLMKQSDTKNTVKIEAHGNTYSLPIACFDNRIDKTTFLRDESDKWQKNMLAMLDRELDKTFDALQA